MNKESAPPSLARFTKLPTLLSTDYYTPMKDDDCSSPGQTRVICYLPTITLPRDRNLSACFFATILREEILFHSLIDCISFVKNIYPLHGRQRVSTMFLPRVGVSTLAYLPSKRSYLRGDSFFQRLTIARGTGSAGYNTGSLFPTNWKRARHLKRRSNMNPSTRPDLYVFKRNSH